MKELERKTRICVCWREGREGLGCAIGLGYLDSCYTEVAGRERLQQAEGRLDHSGTWKVEMESYGVLGQHLKTSHFWALGWNIPTSVEIYVIPCLLEVLAGSQMCLINNNGGTSKFSKCEVHGENINKRRQRVRAVPWRGLPACLGF